MWFTLKHHLWVRFFNKFISFFITIVSKTDDGMHTLARSTSCHIQYTKPINFLRRNLIPDLNYPSKFSYWKWFLSHQIILIYQYMWLKRIVISFKNVYAKIQRYIDMNLNQSVWKESEMKTFTSVTLRRNYVPYCTSNAVVKTI